MCGIAGYLGASPAEPEAVLFAMATALEHRGPDDDGVFVDPLAGVGLAFRRLAVIDTSPDGAQPMSSASGRYTIVYNGEIYNFRDLRRELEAGGHAFRGKSDTEVLLNAIERWGVRGALDRCNGMFAFAVWDADDRVLWLARDRIGEKPLYYATLGSTFLFASELKAFDGFPGFSPEVDRSALWLLLRHAYIPAPRSIYRDVHKLPPGTMLCVRPGRPIPSPEPYWRASDVIRRVRSKARFNGSLDEAAEQLDELLRDAVARRMIADVPLGAFLSGGIDSSTVVALMQAQHDSPIRTFTIGFEDPAFDESPYARAVARHLGTDHSELYVDDAEAMRLIPELPFVYDEPFADASQIPTILVSQLARRDVTVAISGDGGDELFGGYDRYFATDELWRRIVRVPASARWVFAQLAHVLRPVADPLSLPRPLRRLVLATNYFGRRDVLALYEDIVSYWKDASVVLGLDDPPSAMHGADTVGLDNPIEQMMYADLLTYLPDDLLAKVDRAAMSRSLETRLPMLDPRIVELAWSLPLAYRVSGRRSKVVLRRVLERYVPNELIERPKMGFSVPLSKWLRGPLREWAEELLDPRRLRNDGYFDAGTIRTYWDEHTSGLRDRKFMLWSVLMFQAWLDRPRRWAHQTPATRS